jgi:hypothetical protein
LAAATRKADASASAALSCVKAGLPLDEDTFFPPEPARASTPPQQLQPEKQQQAVSPTRGAQVLQPRSARAAAGK